MNAIVEAMRDDYRLPRGAPVVLAESLGVSMQTVHVLSRAITRLALLYRADVASTQDTLDRAAAGARECVMAIRLYDAAISWDDIHAPAGDSEHPKSGSQSATTSASEDQMVSVDVPVPHPAFLGPIARSVSMLEGRVVLLEREVATLRSALAERTAMYDSLRARFMSLSKETERVLEQDVQNVLSSQEKQQQYIIEVGLPTTAKVLGEPDAPVAYHKEFLRAFSSLNPSDRRHALRVITDLAQQGARHVRKRQEHKKLPRDRGHVPAGSMLSKVTRSIRIAWNYEGEKGNKHLVVYLVGTHNVFWDSEK